MKNYVHGLKRLFDHNYQINISSKLSSITRRRNLVIQQRCQEIRIVFTGDLSREISSRKLELVTLGCVGGE